MRLADVKPLSRDLVSMQRLVGNRAVVAALTGSSRRAGHMLAVQRCGPVSCDCSEGERAEYDAHHQGEGQSVAIQRDCDPSTQSCAPDEGIDVQPPDPVEPAVCVAGAEAAAGCDSTTATCAPTEATSASVGSGPASGGVAAAGSASLAPPGTCTPGQHARLQAEVDAACDRDRRCYTADDCATLLSRIQANQECIKARVRINAACFRGGDPGHITAVTYAVNSLINCWAVYSRKCQPSPVPAPEPERVPERREAPEPDRGFLDKMAAITGLTGAALITYLIISEGSRIVFPPRNLIPVP